MGKKKNRQTKASAAANDQDANRLSDLTPPSSPLQVAAETSSVPASPVLNASLPQQLSPVLSTTSPTLLQENEHPMKNTSLQEDSSDPLVDVEKRLSESGVEEDAATSRPELVEGQLPQPCRGSEESSMLDEYTSGEGIISEKFIDASIVEDNKEPPLLEAVSESPPEPEGEAAAILDGCSSDSLPNGVTNSRADPTASNASEECVAIDPPILSGRESETHSEVRVAVVSEIAPSEKSEHDAASENPFETPLSSPIARPSSPITDHRTPQTDSKIEESITDARAGTPSRTPVPSRAGSLTPNAKETEPLEEVLFHSPSPQPRSVVQEQPGLYNRQRSSTGILSASYIPSQPQSPVPSHQSHRQASYPSGPGSTYQQSYYNHTLPAQFFYPMAHSNGYPNINPFGVPSAAHITPFHQSYPGALAGYGQGSPYGTSPATHRHPSIGSKGSVPGEIFGGPMPGVESPPADDDHADGLLARISSAIPDLHLLLSQYKENHGQLSVREAHLKDREQKLTDLVQRKDDHIDVLTKELEGLKRQHASDTNKFRLEIGNLEEKQKELEDRVAEAEASRKLLGTAQLAAQAEKAALERHIQNLEVEKEALERRIAEERHRLVNEFEDMKRKSAEAHDVEKRILEQDFEKNRKEQEEAYEDQKSQLHRDSVQEKDNMRAAFQRQKRDLEASFDNVRRELETKLNDTLNSLDEALKNEREGRSVWSAERASLTRGWQEERDSMIHGFEEQRKLLLDTHRRELEDRGRAWMELQAELIKRGEEETASLMEEKEKMRKEWEEDRAGFDRIVGELRVVAESLGNEKGRLQKMIDGFSDVTSVRPRGDAYYLDAFSQLSKQILDLAKACFYHLPVLPPEEIIAQIPPELPSILGNTVSSRQLRVAYIAHLIGKLLTDRVFTPFLFGLGFDGDRTDGALKSISNHWRGKSTRREAAWRQSTLLAAFTGPEAKNRINVAAGHVVEEIVRAIKWFADPAEEEKITVAVRRIVKSAAETWRYARIERELITAYFPVTDELAINQSCYEVEVPLPTSLLVDEAQALWPSMVFDTSASLMTDTNCIIQTPQERCPPRLILRLFPVIFREPFHETCQMMSDDQRDTGCFYSYGIALYDNSPAVLQRFKEPNAAMQLVRDSLDDPSALCESAPSTESASQLETVDGDTTAFEKRPLAAEVVGERHQAPLDMTAGAAEASTGPPHSTAGAWTSPSQATNSCFRIFSSPNTRPCTPSRPLALDLPASNAASPSSRSRPQTPPSPLYPAVDEIDTRSSHLQSSRGSASLSRRSTAASTSNAIYVMDARSAAVKGLYGSAPLVSAVSRAKLERTTSQAGSVGSSFRSLTKKSSEGSSYRSASERSESEKGSERMKSSEEVEKNKEEDCMPRNPTCDLPTGLPGSW